MTRAKKPKQADDKFVCPDCRWKRKASDESRTKGVCLECFRKREVNAQKRTYIVAIPRGKYILGDTYRMLPAEAAELVAKIARGKGG